MNQRDERLGEELRALDVPAHGPDFFARLAQRLEEEAPAADHRLRRRPDWATPALLRVLAAAAVVVAVVGVGTMLVSNRSPVVVQAGGGNDPAGTTVTTPGSGSILSTPTTVRPGTTALTADSTLDVGGLGPVRVGMTLAEATAAAGIPIVAPSDTAECTYARAEGGPADVLFMIIDGRIARVDVRAGSPVKTLSGAGIGDTEAQVQALYSNGLEVSLAKYDPNGHNLTLVPKEAADAAFRLIFETDGTTVTMFRSGKLPEVAFVEGCS